MAGNILDELDGLIDQVSQRKLAAAKIAGPISTKLDGKEDGTTTASTGEQMADQQRAQNEQYPDNMTDTGAKDNEVGGSVDNSTDQATAVAPSGQEGTEGSQLGMEGEVSDDPKSAPDIPTNSGMNSGAFKQAAAKCLKIAKQLEKAAEELIQPMDRFLIDSMRQHPDPQIRKQAMDMADDELAAGAADSLMADIAQGNVSDEEAASILQEAVEAGVISEEEVAEAAQAAQAAMAEGGGEMGGEMPPEAEEELMEAKLAAADIGPDDPRYIQKLAGLYSADVQAGYAYGMQLGQKLAQEAEVEGDEAYGGEETPEEEAAEAAMAEAGEEGEEAGEEAAEAGAEMAGAEGDMAEAGAEMAGAEGALDEMAPEAEALAPENEGEEADLAAVAQELGLTPEQAEQLLAAPMAEAAGGVPLEGGPEMLGKMASALKAAGVPYKARVRAVLLNKVAALGQ